MFAKYVIYFYFKISSHLFSTSLNSIEADGHGSSSNTVDGNVAGVLHVGSLVNSKVISHLEKSSKVDSRNNNYAGRPVNSNEFIRSSQRSSYTGPGFFHKSISSPSMQRYRTIITRRLTNSSA